MAVRLEFKCDGCDRSTMVDANAKPTGWGSVRIAITGLNIPFDYKGDEKTKTFDLCPTCQQRVLYNACPDEWLRLADPGPDYAEIVTK